MGRRKKEIKVGVMQTPTNMKMMFTCDCGDTDKFARQSMALLFPGYILPPVKVTKSTKYETPDVGIISGADAVKSWANKMRAGSPMRDLLLGIANSKEPFAYYFEYEDEHDRQHKVALPTRGYDLLTGVRVY